MVSSKPRKQRKALYSAPLHRRQKMVSAHLSKELREKFGRRSLPVRKGDEVAVVRGSFRGKTGKVERVELKKLRVFVEGLVRRKSDGSEVKVPIHPSNLVIISADMSDKKRQKIVERVVA